MWGACSKEWLQGFILGDKVVLKLDRDGVAYIMNVLNATELFTVK